MELVSFISIEDEPPDLILSFAIWQPELEDIRSLILLRTPEYEFILDEAERGVKVSDEALADDEYDTRNISSHISIIIELKLLARKLKFLKALNF